MRQVYCGSERRMHFFTIIIDLVVSFLAMTWLSLAFWTFNDSRTRSQNVVTQVIATLIVLPTGPFGLFLYWILRPQQTLMEAYAHSLQEETLLQEIESQHLCPTCNAHIDNDFKLCPSCHTRLREECQHCHKLLVLGWEVCPYCGIKHSTAA